MRAYYRKVSQKAQKLDKEQLLKLIDGVVNENENLYSIFDSISAGIIIVDNDFVIKQNNTLAESRLNFNRPLDYSRANKIQLWELIDDQDISEFFKRCYQKNITNCNEDFSTTTEGGTVRFITITMTPLMSGNDNSYINGRIIVIRDVTDKKNQEIMIHRMENMAGLTNLAAGMAHDIKNPLGAISIHIQLIQKALQKARENENILPDKKFVEDHIDVVNEEIEFLNRLVMDFLFAVRPVNAKLELKSPSTIIESVCKFINPEFSENGFEVQFEDLTNGSKIMIDEKLFRDVIMNLTTNANAAMLSQKQSVPDFRGVYKISSYIKENKYVIKIHDNGCGMSPETVAKIFEPYFTTKSNGTGLGMTTVYKIIKEFSGEILVDSTPGEGTIFTLKLPLHLDQKLAINN